MTPEIGTARNAPALAAIALGLTGCIVGPDYVRPEPALPDAWHHAAVRGLEAGGADLERWWLVFDDVQLARLVERTAVDNRDLKSALARIRAARAARGSATGERYPDVDAFGALERSRSSEGLLVPFGGTTDRQALGGQAFWELDLFGRITRSIEAADASLAASIEDYRDLLVVLLAEVGSTYVEVRSLQARIGFLEGNIETQRSSLELARARFETEVEPELDLRQAELNLASTESALPSLRLALARALHRLGVLVGAHPGALWGQLGERAPIPAPPASVAVGVPADLLRQRPDVRRAERELAAASARIGVATAQLYPIFSLGGTLSFLSTDALLDHENLDGAGGARFSWNVFDGGRVRNAIRAEEAQSQGAYQRYEQTVLLALEDVENSLVGYVEEQERRDALARSAAAARRSVELVVELYRLGLTDFQNVLDTQRSRFVQEDLLAESEGNVAQSLISVYRALGGGWAPDPAALAREREEAEEGEPIF